MQNKTVAQMMAEYRANEAKREKQVAIVGLVFVSTILIGVVSILAIGLSHAYALQQLNH